MEPSPSGHPDQAIAQMPHPPWCTVAEDTHESDAGTWHQGHPIVVTGYPENTSMETPTPIKVCAEWWEPVPQLRDRNPPESVNPLVTMTPGREPVLSFTAYQARQLAAALTRVADQLEPPPATTA